MLFGLLLVAFSVRSAIHAHRPREFRGATTSSIAFAINDGGEITGSSQLTAGGSQVGVIFANGFVSALNSASGCTPIQGSAINSAINSAGVITGPVGCGGAIYMFVYANRILQVVPGPGVGPTQSDGAGINSSGVITGQAGFTGALNDGWIVANGVDSRASIPGHAYPLIPGSNSSSGGGKSLRPRAAPPCEEKPKAPAAGVSDSAALTSCRDIFMS